MARASNCSLAALQVQSYNGKVMKRYVIPTPGLDMDHSPRYAVVKRRLGKSELPGKAKGEKGKEGVKGKDEGGSKAPAAASTAGQRPRTPRPGDTDEPKVNARGNFDGLRGLMMMDIGEVETAAPAWVPPSPTPLKKLAVFFNSIDQTPPRRPQEEAFAEEVEEEDEDEDEDEEREEVGGESEPSGVDEGDKDANTTTVGDDAEGAVEDLPDMTDGRSGGEDDKGRPVDRSAEEYRAAARIQGHRRSSDVGNRMFKKAERGHGRPVALPATAAAAHSAAERAAKERAEAAAAAGSEAQALQLSEAEKAMNGAPEGELFVVVVLEAIELEPYASDEARDEALNDVVSPALCCGEDKEPAWNVRFNALTSLRRLLVHHCDQPALAAAVPSLCLRGVQRAARSLRSSLAKNAIAACGDLLHAAATFPAIASALTTAVPPSIAGGEAAAGGAVLEALTAVLLESTAASCPKAVRDAAASALDVVGRAAGRVGGCVVTGGGYGMCDWIVSSSPFCDTRTTFSLSGGESHHGRGGALLLSPAAGGAGGPPQPGRGGVGARACGGRARARQR